MPASSWRAAAAPTRSPWPRRSPSRRRSSPSRAGAVVVDHGLQDGSAAVAATAAAQCRAARPRPGRGRRRRGRRRPRGPRGRGPRSALRRARGGCRPAGSRARAPRPHPRRPGRAGAARPGPRLRRPVPLRYAGPRGAASRRPLLGLTRAQTAAASRAASGPDGRGTTRTTTTRLRPGPGPPRPRRRWSATSARGWRRPWPARPTSCARTPTTSTPSRPRPGERLGEAPQPSAADAAGRPAGGPDPASGGCSLDGRGAGRPGAVPATPRPATGCSPRGTGRARSRARAASPVSAIRRPGVHRRRAVGLNRQGHPPTCTRRHQESHVDAAHMGADLETVLITEEEIHAKLDELAGEIWAGVRGQGPPARRGPQGRRHGHGRPHARPARHRARSTGWRSRPTARAPSPRGVVRILKDLDTDITGKHVLIVEDIVDSGLTLSWIKSNLESRSAGLGRDLHAAAQAGGRQGRDRRQVGRVRHPQRVRRRLRARLRREVPQPARRRHARPARLLLSRTLPQGRSRARRNTVGNCSVEQHRRRSRRVYRRLIVVFRRDRGAFADRAGGPGRQAPHTHGLQAHSSRPRCSGSSLVVAIS